MKLYNSAILTLFTWNGWFFCSHIFIHFISLIRWLILFAADFCFVTFQFHPNMFVCVFFFSYKMFGARVAVHHMHIPSRSLWFRYSGGKKYMYSVHLIFCFYNYYYYNEIGRWHFFSPLSSLSLAVYIRFMWWRRPWLVK